MVERKEEEEEATNEKSQLMFMFYSLKLSYKNALLYSRYGGGNHTHLFRRFLSVHSHSRVRARARRDNRSERCIKRHTIQIVEIAILRRVSYFFCTIIFN